MHARFRDSIGRLYGITGTLRVSATAYMAHFK
jgi:hypothetical protein